MKTLLPILFFFSAIFFLPDYASAYPDLASKAQQYTYVREQGDNDGKEVRLFLRSVGLGKGHSWCAAFISYCLLTIHSSFPVRSPLARAFITSKSIKARDVLYGKYIPQRNDLIIWRRGETPFGHIAVNVQTIKFNSFSTIEGNTSSGNKGNQHNGNGVYARIRSIVPGNYFRITHFTPTN